MNFTNKVVLVTGANRGIGLAIVRELLSRGVAKVYAGTRNPSNLPDFADPRVVGLQLDLREPESLARAAETASDIDLLVNNAGVATFGSLLDAPTASIRGDMEVNYFGTLEVIRQFVPVLEKRSDAALVNVTSIAAFASFPSLGGYSASKAALYSLSQAIRIELEGRGITVHTVNPGPIDTDMARDFEMDKTSADVAARNILDGLAEDEADIFPDPASQQMFSVWHTDYRELERAVAQMHQAG